MRTSAAVALVWAIIFAVPFVLYGAASGILDLKPPAASPLRLLSGIAITKLGTAVAFVALFAVPRGRWPRYAALWFLAFAASEVGDFVRAATTAAEALLGIASEAIYAPLSAFAVDRLLRRPTPLARP